jgi:ankyrin repeat protein
MTSCMSINIFKCCYNGHSSCITNYVNKGHNLNIVNRYRNTLLHEALRGNSIQCVKILINGGADIYLENTHGETPFHYAVLISPTDIIRIFLENGADLEHAQETYKYAGIGMNRIGKNIEFIKEWDESFFIKQPDC